MKKLFTLKNMISTIILCIVISLPMISCQKEEDMVPVKKTITTSTNALNSSNENIPVTLKESLATKGAWRVYYYERTTTIEYYKDGKLIARYSETVIIIVVVYSATSNGSGDQIFIVPSSGNQGSGIDLALPAAIKLDKPDTGLNYGILIPAQQAGPWDSAQGGYAVKHQVY